METASTLFALLLLFSLLMLIVSAFTPKTAWFYKTKTKKKGALTWLAVAILATFIGAGFHTPVEKTATPQPQATKAESAPAAEPEPAAAESARLETAAPPAEEAPIAAAPSPASLPTLDFTLSEFAANYNQFSQALKTTPLSLSAVKRQDGPVAATAIFSADHISMVIQMPLDSDQVTGAIFFGTADDTEVSGAKLILGALNFVSALTPQMDGDSRGEVAKQLGLPAQVADGQQRVWQDQRIRLTSQFSDLTGLNITAAPL